MDAVKCAKIILSLVTILIYGFLIWLCKEIAPAADFWEMIWRGTAAFLVIIGACVILVIWREPKLPAMSPISPMPPTNELIKETDESGR